MKGLGVTRFLPVDQAGCFVEHVLGAEPPKGRDLQVHIKAVSVNPIDCKMRASVAGELSVPKILGWDASGVVTAVGPDVTLFRPGDEVYYAGSISRPGCNSEYHLVDERIVGRKPGGLSHGEAAALPLTTITAWESLFERLLIPLDPQHNAGTSILIIGAAGGVGSMAIQLAKYAGLTVVATASRDVSKRWCLQLGADFCLDHQRHLVAELDRVDLAGVNYILCLNDVNYYWQAMADIIQPQGRICAVVSAKEPLDLTVLKNKSVGFAWEFMFTKAMYETDDMVSQHELLNRVADLVERGIIKTTMTEQGGPLTAANLARAHQRVESGQMVGKYVLSGFGA
ncbi:zinc-binding alcohol dehydrogenase family protein [Leptothoe kymatousa]|uniref:Zinc-type alcohol dehydrogenase-like protein n=1 Tax=Leptothoe kymatousa TAU-MAC 1615 TaxID=2364775 RepID=A0ABS5Y2K3_9CYAN|nr:zinc-binding alcohol dehydrogenase family protein [Leptothoe kymatousa]MBT9312068.1 zinc-binding alcohol dehydrogenase family protein [Leptothoe kymatousa TAU-MAC 1615]